MSTRKRRKKPIDDAKTHILSCTDKVGFMSRYIDGYKGRGVFATPPNEPGDFVLEYRGKLLTKEECESRRYSETESKFLFGFKWQNHCLCLDASEEDGSLGRLVNDNHKNPNCVMKKIIVDNKPHLCLFSLKKIEIGAEIYYNYGDSKWPWRSKVGKNKAPAAAKENLLGGEGQTIHMEGPLAEDIEGDKGSDDEVSMSSRQECTSISESQNQRVSATDVSMPEEGSEHEVSMSSLQECTSTPQVQNQTVSAKKRDVSMPEEGSEHEVSMSSLQECTSTPQVQNQTVSAKKREKQTAVKRSWTPEECAAVDKHLRRFIVRSQVPGKEECQRCITAAPEALRNRDWKAGKYYVKNRITALRRKVV
ncbi:troponin T, slow skeletal muscle isoform X2 [Nothobranchius furzeri]|uniref:troponin T, slow skeletal muscle isoform X2 n=1 Tax=Nothobranchius furzeri TaxID=105023 RepID=UPI003904AA3A